jgi:hypothetical protein
MCFRQYKGSMTSQSLNCENSCDINFIMGFGSIGRCEASSPWRAKRLHCIRQFYLTDYFKHEPSEGEGLEMTGTSHPLRSILATVQ